MSGEELIMRWDVIECGHRLWETPADDWPNEVLHELTALRQSLAERPLRLSDRTTKEQAAILLALQAKGIVRLILSNPTVAELVEGER